MATLARVALIGPDVVTGLFPDENPIGQTLRIADVPFQVKGILESRGVGPGGASMDNTILIPVTTASKRLFNRDYLTAVIAQLKDPTRAAGAIADITALLRERHGIIPPAEDDFRVSSPEAQVMQITEVSSTLSKVLVGVAVIATLIGGTVIMSLMLIAVSERRREIGIRTLFNILGPLTNPAGARRGVLGVFGVVLDQVLTRLGEVAFGPGQLPVVAPFRAVEPGAIEIIIRLAGRIEVLDKLALQTPPTTS